MCLCPIKIKNPKIRANTFLPGSDKEYLLVPCGHCEECNFKRVNDLVFRAYHEYFNTISLNGFVLFQTLTYTESFVPENQGFKYFRKKDLQNFLKRLRKRLSDDGYPVEGSLTYLITSEYGSLRFRPHYHVLFFVRFAITPAEFDQYINYAWTSLASKYSRESIGRTDLSSVQKRIVNSIYAIRYVCKYIYKGTSVVDAIKHCGWSDLSHYVHDFCFTSGSNILWKDLKDYQVSRIWKSYVVERPELKDYQLMPFYLQSKGFGLSWLSEASYDDLFDVVMLPSQSPNGFAPFTIPNYYIRKVFYKYDKDSKRYILNEDGRQYKSYVNGMLVDSFDDVFTHNLELYNKIYQLHYGNNESLPVYISRILNNRKLDDFIKYCVYLKDRPISPLHEFLIPNDTKRLFDYFDEFCDIVFNDSISEQIADLPSFVFHKDAYLFDSLKYEEFKKVPLSVYNNLPCFNGFDELYNRLQVIKRDFHESHCRSISERFIKEKHKQDAKKLFTPASSIYY